MFENKIIEENLSLELFVVQGSLKNQTAENFVSFIFDLYVNFRTINSF